MRPLSKAALLLAAGTFLLPAAPAVQAADLAVSPARHVHYKRLRVVADYDGTPIVVHRFKVVSADWYGNPVVDVRLVHQPVIGYPTYYFNGQPIRRGALAYEYRRIW